MWLLRWRTGLAMTVLVGAMQADSRGSVVGRGRGDCSCLTVSSYRVRQEDVDLLLLKKDSFALILSKYITYVCMGVYVYLLALL